MIHLSRVRSMRSNKHFVLLVAGGVLLVAVIAYGLWSRQVWTQYTPAYMQWRQGIKADIKAITTLPVANSQEQDELLVQLERISWQIASEQEGLCKVNTWVEWQRQYIAAYQDAQMACQKKIADIATFQQHLDAVITYIKNDQALAAIVVTVAPPSELTDDTWEKQAAAWDEAAMATAKLSASDVFKPTQQQAVEKMTAVKVAWQELLTAHQQKDKTKYLAAQEKLGASYDGLHAVVADSENRLADLTASLNSAHAKSFH